MLLCFCLGWIFGTAWMGKTGFDSLLGTAMALLSFVFIVITSKLLTQQRLFVKTLSAGLVLCLGGYLGFAYANQQLKQRLQYTVHQPESTSVVVYVHALNQYSENSIQQRVQVLNTARQPIQYLLYLAKTKAVSTSDLELELGKYYQIEGQLKPAHTYATAGVFDQEKWLLQQNIQATFRVKHAVALDEVQIKALGYADIWWQQHTAVQQFRLWTEKQRLAFRVKILHLPLAHKGLLLALLTGDKSLLDVATVDQFQRFGISHLLAISGPHVLIFAVLICWMITRFIRRFAPRLYLKIPRQFILIWPFIGCVFVYCAFVGFEIPAMRTLIMTVVASGMLLLRLKIQALKLLVYSATILLLFDPFSILSAAFWLSYGACFILLRIYQTLWQHQQALEAHASVWTKLRLSLHLLITSQWKIFIALFPMMALFFKQVAWIAPLSNLIAIPTLGLVVVPLDVLAAFVDFFAPAVASVFFQFNDLCLSLLLSLFDAIDHVFNPQLLNIALNPAMLLLLSLCICILYLPDGVVPKAWLFLGLVAICLKAYMPQTFQLTVLDVGQGQSILLREGKHSMMVDTGGYYDEKKFSIGKNIILPYLSRQGLSSIDQLVLTHLDQDHSGAYFSIQDQLAVKKLYASEHVDVPTGTQFEYCQRGQVWQWENVRIEVLSPNNIQTVRAGAQRNENSCVLYIRLANAMPYQTYLLMGDAGWQTEYELLNAYPNLQVDVLVLGHHGSRHSSSFDFLRHYQPKLAIASAGKWNRYGHPSKETLARLKALNIPLLSTAEKGSIEFKAKESHIQIIAYRDQWQWLSH